MFLNFECEIGVAIPYYIRRYERNKTLPIIYCFRSVLYYGNAFIVEYTGSVLSACCENVICKYIKYLQLFMVILFCFCHEIPKGKLNGGVASVKANLQDCDAVRIRWICSTDRKSCSNLHSTL